MDNVAGKCLAICPLFEAELLLHLMLANWGHPFANDENFRQELLESATELLSLACEESCGEIFIENMSPQEMNLISALWYSEWCAAQDDPRDRELRQEWLNSVRRALPSCFCPSDLLET